MAQRQVQAFQVWYDYTAAKPDELTIHVGDELTVLDQSRPDWWLGKNRATGAQVRRPTNAPRPLPPPSDPPASPQGWFPKAYGELILRQELSSSTSGAVTPRAEPVAPVVEAPPSPDGSAFSRSQSKVRTDFARGLRGGEERG
jgi:hypothetical protein